MKTQELKSKKAIDQNIELVNGTFTASEASHIINRLIDEKINFHKIQRMQRFESDHITGSDFLNDRIYELEKEKEISKDFISKVRTAGGKLKINGILEISVIK